ncbi:MAG: hypothetical protein CL905_02875 [Dehalococcoidia bacterium]|nr:hypothetical protein [Dehalococcoidia bacterium]
MGDCGIEMTTQISKTVIIPTRNEEEYIEDCINSLLEGSNVINSTEFIIVDGKSSDRTLDIVREKFQHLNLKILNNSNVFQASALNLGIENSSSNILEVGSDSQIIIRADAHSVYPENYLALCVEALQKNLEVGNAGSIQKAVGKNYFSKAIALVMNSTLGMGGVKYRKIGNEKLESDTAYLGCWWKADLLKLGGFNEDFQINEDYELNIRIRKFLNNNSITINPNLIVDYFVRTNFLGLLKQFFRYGLWKTKTLSIHPDSLKKRQLAPVLFVLFLVSLIIGNLILSYPYLEILNWIGAIVGLFWLIMIIDIWKDSPKIINVFLIPIVVLSMHISWGLGFLYGLLRWTRGGWNRS